MRFSILFFLTLCLSNSILFGQENDSISVKSIMGMSIEDLLQIPVEVSNVKSGSIFQSPSSITVIDREMIMDYGYHTVAEVLGMVAGIEVLQSVIDINIPTSRGILQNFYANKILLLINNIPTWQPIYGNGFIDRVSLADIERIEVLKGPASVLYGSNAYSGVINIVLYSSEKNLFKGNIKTGYPDFFESGVNVSYSAKGLNTIISANAFHDQRPAFDYTSARGYYYNGDSVFSYSQEQHGENFNLVSTYKNHRLLFNYFSFDFTFPGAQPSFIGGGGSFIENNGILAGYGYTHQGENSNLMLNFYYDGYSRDFSLSVDKGNYIKLKGDRLGGDFKSIISIKKWLNFECGLATDLRVSRGHDTYNGIKDTLIRNNLIEDDAILESSLFGQVDVSLPWINILAGSRFTYNELFGENIASRISIVKEINEKSSLKLIYGESFRAPSMFELYFNHPTVTGNRNLKPEVSKSIEMSYLVKFPNIYLHSLVYYNQNKNLIQRYNPTGVSPSVYRNVSELEGWGVEIESRFELEICNLFLNYTLIKGVSEKDEVNYQYVPDNTLGIGVKKNIKRFWIAANGKYVSPVMGHLGPIESQAIGNLSCGFKQFSKKVKIRHILSLKNITNSDMNIPEYIRLNSNINSIPTMKNSRRVVYSLNFEF